MITKLKHATRVTTLWLKQPICFYSAKALNCVYEEVHTFFSTCRGFYSYTLSLLLFNRNDALVKTISTYFSLKKVKMVSFLLWREDEEFVTAKSLIKGVLSCRRW